MEYVSPSQRHIQPEHLIEEVAYAPIGEPLTLKVSGVNPYGKPIEFFAELKVPAGESGEERVQKMGLTLLPTDEQIEVNGEQIKKILIDNVEIDSPAAKANLNWDQVILDVSLPLKGALNKEWMFIPALLILTVLAWNQRRRKFAEGK